MQKVAAYLLERRDGVDTTEKRTAEVKRLLGVLRAWLEQKGAKELDADTGTFEAQNNQGTFSWEHAQSQGRSWRLLRLDESTDEGKRFQTAVSIADTGSLIAVYVSLEAGLSYSTIAPISIHPRCPRFIRAMLELDGDWYHGKTQIFKRRRLIGEEAGREIAREILAKERTLPIVLLSEDDGKVLIPKLDENLAFDLAGLANVCVLDHDAAWGVTETLGRPWSCYWGAVRAYWPHVELISAPHQHPLWTAKKLLGSYEDLNRASDRFREQLRRMFMQVSALTVLRPREIDDIRGSVARGQIEELQRNARSVGEFSALAEMYAAENDRLRIESEKLREELNFVQKRLENAQTIAAFQSPEALDFEPEKPTEVKEEGPKPGDIRFYKKTHSAGPHDILIPIQDCGHDKWQRANKAHKAQKGVARLEGRRDWNNFWHCGSCDGGGVWKVRW